MLVTRESGSARAALQRLPYNQILHQINTTMKFPLRIGVLIWLNILPVPTRFEGNRTKERSRKFHGYIYP